MLQMAPNENRLGYGKRGDIKPQLGLQPEGRPTGDQHLQFGACLQKRCNGGTCRYDLLEIVQHQKCSGALQVWFEGRKEWRAKLFPYLQGSGNRWNNQVGFGN